MEDITHHAQYAIVPQFGGGSSGLGEPAACPDHDSVSQSAQQHDHLLGLKAFLAALSTAQALMVALKGGLDATATLIIQVYIGKPHGGSIGIGPSCRLGQGQHFPRRERRDQHADAPLLIGLAAAQRKASHGTSIFRGGQAHPADLSPLSLRIIDPLLHACCQAPSAGAGVIFAVDLIATYQQPIHVIHAGCVAWQNSLCWQKPLWVHTACRSYPCLCTLVGVRTSGQPKGATTLPGVWPLLDSMNQIQVD